MIRTLVKNWWLLALCGVLDAAISAIYLVMHGTNGPVLSRSWSGTVVLVGKVAVAAGVCTVVAAVWRSRNGTSWGLALNGLALAALGLIQYGLTRFPISILAFSVLIIVMAVSIGVVELSIARDFRRQHHVADAWFFRLVGIASVSLVLPSLAVGLRWVPLERGSHLDLLWLASYFGLAAVGMIALSVRLHGQNPFPSGRVPSQL
ncbi:MAG: hypothetical protein HYS04_13850 [Acidobacteria bacterium]|nr:hypothetical protein [Acidobacteriota bacterium]